MYSLSLGNGGAKRLTRALNPAIDASQLVEGEVVRFADYDGLAIPGILYIGPVRPERPNPGAGAGVGAWRSGRTSRKGYRAELQHLVNHGYTVLRDQQPRLLRLRQKTFYHLDDQRHGEADLADVVASQRLARRSRLDRR